jgi:hypothetical protein
MGAKLATFAGSVNSQMTLSGYYLGRVWPEHHGRYQKEHAAMVLEWIRRNDGAFSRELRDYLFTAAPQRSS